MYSSLKWNILYLLIAVFFLVLSIPYAANAQYNLVIPSDATLQLSPKFPGANEVVTASLISYGTDLDTARITWYVNGVQKISGFSERSFTFVTGASGTITEVRAVIVTRSGQQIERFETITSGDITLLWEAVDGYVPPFYKGKKLAVRDSRIKAVAVPVVFDASGKQQPKEDLIFDWFQGNALNRNSSGLGRSGFLFQQNFTKSNEEIELEISTRDRRLSIKDKFTIPLFSPDIIFYEHTTSDGVDYSRGYKDSLITRNSRLSLKAEPYFMPYAKGAPGKMVGEWDIEGRELLDDVLILTSSGQKGATDIDYNIQGSKSLYHEFSETLRINFQ